MAKCLRIEHPYLHGIVAVDFVTLQSCLLFPAGSNNILISDLLYAAGKKLLVLDKVMLISLPSANKTHLFVTRWGVQSSFYVFNIFQLTGPFSDIAFSHHLLHINCVILLKKIFVVFVLIFLELNMFTSCRHSSITLKLNFAKINCLFGLQVVWCLLLWC